MNIPIIKPNIDRYVDSVKGELVRILKSNMVTNGEKVKALESEICKKFNFANTVALSSCTSGLILGMKELELNSKEIILPSFTFCATAHAASWNNCKLKFVDIEEDTLTIDPEKVKETITKETKAIIGVHMYGNPCNIKELVKIANDNNLKL